MQKNKTIVIASIGLVVLSLILTATTYAALTTTQSLSSSGSITVSPNLGVYSDSACTVPLSSITWGSLSAGGSATKTVYVKNTGSGASLTLGMSTSNWNPANANSYITVTWNPVSSTIAPGASTTAVITLNVSPSVVDITNFSVQITISGTTP